ncbi:hypothetical protein QQM79_20305 [Marinobacteraceae bacterium S3BR75-40.1]
MSPKTKILISLTLLFLSLQAYPQVEVDITAKEVEEMRGTLRVRDLVVNDEARIYGGSLCIRDSKLYLPDNVVLSPQSVNDSSIDLKIRLLPAKKVAAETVMPKTNEPKRVRESIERFLSSTLMPSWFDNEPVYCDEKPPTDVTGQEIEYLEIQSIDGFHSLRKVYENLLNTAN